MIVGLVGARQHNDSNYGSAEQMSAPAPVGLHSKNYFCANCNLDSVFMRSVFVCVPVIQRAISFPPSEPLNHDAHPCDWYEWDTHRIRLWSLDLFGLFVQVFSLENLITCALRASQLKNYKRREKKSNECWRTRIRIYSHIVKSFAQPCLRGVPHSQEAN